jgi:hypothetical protein
MTIEQAVEILQSGPDPYTRCSAVDSLAHAEHTPMVLQLLLNALSDEGYYEIPEPGAPSFIYSVAELASQALESWGSEAFVPLVVAMKACDKAAVWGAWHMPRHGQAGLGVLQELLQHANSKVVGAALGASSQVLREGLRGVPELVSALFPTTLHLDGQVRYSASSSLAYFFKAHPELDPNSFVGPDFLAQLADGIATCRILPEVGRLFSDDDRIFAGSVEWACQGYEQGTWPLMAQLERIDSAQVRKLANGKLTPALITLLGELGPRAAEAVPALVQAKNDPALEAAAMVALLQVSFEMAPDHDRLTDLFFEQENARAGILANHPDPEALAAGLIPRLIEQWNRTKDLKALRGLKTLGPLMLPAMPWLLAQLQMYPSEKHARTYAINILSTFGAEAKPAFDKLALLLDNTDARGSVLKALARLGPVAAPDFLLVLEVLEEESRSWVTWQKNWWREPVVAALKSVRGLQA